MNRLRLATALAATLLLAACGGQPSDAQTFVEQGYPEITKSTTTFGVIAPAGTPQPVIARLEETMRAASADPETRRGLDERYVPVQFMGSAELAALFTETGQTFQGVASG